MIIKYRRFFAQPIYQMPAPSSQIGEEIRFAPARVLAKPVVRAPFIIFNLAFEYLY